MTSNFNLNLLLMEHKYLKHSSEILSMVIIYILWLRVQLIIIPYRVVLDMKMIVKKPKYYNKTWNLYHFLKVKMYWNKSLWKIMIFNMITMWPFYQVNNLTLDNLVILVRLHQVTNMSFILSRNWIIRNCNTQFLSVATKIRMV